MAVVRPAHVTDAPRLGRIGLRAWQAAYRGLMPDEFLDGLSAEQRTASWERGLATPSEPGQAQLVVEDDDGEVAGFVVTGPTRSGEGTGEVRVLNVEPTRWAEAWGGFSSTPPSTNFVQGVTPPRSFGSSRAMPGPAGSTSQPADILTGGRCLTTASARGWWKCATAAAPGHQPSRLTAAGRTETWITSRHGPGCRVEPAAPTSSSWGTVLDHTSRPRGRRCDRPA